MVESRPHRGPIVAALAALLLISLAAAPTRAVTGLDLTTPYPGVQVDPGGTVTFPLTITTVAPERVGLAVTTKPDGFETTLRGGGFIVDAVYTVGQTPPSSATEPAVQLQVKVPEAQAAGDYTVVVRATGSAGTTDLSLALSVLAADAGTVSLTSTSPDKGGDTSSTFSFDVSLANDTSQEITFTFDAVGAPDWDISAVLASDEQATTAVVPAGDTASVRVSAQPPNDAVAGVFPIEVTAVDTANATNTAQTELRVTLTGSYSMSMSTLDDVLSTSVTSGGSTDMTLVITNTGSADLTEVSVLGTPPTGWTVTYVPESVASIPVGGTAQIVATIKPADNAIAGDFQVSFRADSAESADDSLEIRTSVQTSSLWGFIGLALIAAVLVGLFLVFRQYGRR